MANTDAIYMLHAGYMDRYRSTIAHKTVNRRIDKIQRPDSLRPCTLLLIVHVTEDLQGILALQVFLPEEEV